MKEITGSTKIIAIIGDPVEHSISPQMHNAAFEKLNINYCYIPFHVLEKDIEKTIQSLKALNIAGFNVTVPHKEKVIKFLDEIDDSAKLIGAVNTVHNKEGKLVGYNTDASGFIDSLTFDAGVDPIGKKIILLGAGGAAKAVAVALCGCGIAELVISDVDKAKADALVSHLKKNFKISVSSVFAKKDIESSLSKTDVLINATPAGMFPNVDQCPLDGDIVFNENLLIYDLVYNPAETKLVKLAKSKGAWGITGLGMLVRQGAASFSIFTGLEPPVEVMREAAQKALRC